MSSGWSPSDKINIQPSAIDPSMTDDGWLETRREHVRAFRIARLPRAFEPNTVPISAPGARNNARLISGNETCVTTLLDATFALRMTRLTVSAASRSHARSRKQRLLLEFSRSAIRGADFVGAVLEI